MAGFGDSGLRPDMDENKIGLSISPAKPADVASPYVISSSVPEAVKNDGKEFKKADQSHGEVLETSWKLISCGNRSREYTNIEQEVSRYQTCNSVTALQGDKHDAGYTRNNSMCDMHEALLFDIMLWLPVKSLLRFRSVCRLWCSLIDSSTFIIQHYNHNSNKSCLLAYQLVLYYDDADYNSKFCLLTGNKYEVYSDLDYGQPWYSVDEITILNSCNGIVSLLNGKSGNVALWNPATKQLRPLPESSIFCQYLPLRNGMNIEFGFGFDAESNDYKFVRILYHYENKHSNLVEVYSLKTDSWRIIHEDYILPFQYIDCDGSIFKNGTCFWIGYTHQDEYSPILICFDLNSEVFETMPLPGQHDSNRVSRPYNALNPLNDQLCYIKGLIMAPGDIYHKYFELWMLGEYDVKESWKKIGKFGPTGTSKWEPPQVLGLSKNVEFLLLGYKHENHELYLSKFDAREEENLELQNRKPLPSKIVRYNKLQNPNPVVSEFVCYNESLVSLKREGDGAYT